MGGLSVIKCLLLERGARKRVVLDTVSHETSIPTEDHSSRDKRAAAHHSSRDGRAGGPPRVVIRGGPLITTCFLSWLVWGGKGSLYKT